MKIRERIRTAVKIRLSQQIPYLNKWHEVNKFQHLLNKKHTYNPFQAMALGLYPENISDTLKKLWKISDDIWFIAGDKSHDVSF